MQKKDDIFSKLVSLKTVFFMAIIGIIVIYTIIGAILIVSNTEFLSSFYKITGPLGIIAIGAVMAVDSFRKLSSDSSAVKVFALISFVLGILSTLFLTLLIWEIIPSYDSSGGFYSYYSSPTIAYKLIMSLTIITIFAFLSAIVLSIKNNHKVVHLLKPLTIGFLSIAVLVSIINIFADFSKDLYGTIRMTILQIIFWISSVGMGAMAFFVSKSIIWDTDDTIIDDIIQPSPKPASIASSSVKPDTLINTEPLTKPTIENTSPSASLESSPSNASTIEPLDTETIESTKEETVFTSFQDPNTPPMAQ